MDSGEEKRTRERGKLSTNMRKSWEAGDHVISTFAEYSQIATFGNARVMIGVRKLMSTFTSTLNMKSTEHQQHVCFTPIENIYLSYVS
jgi:hypothetical protein